VLEHLHSGYSLELDAARARGPRTLFATHYFELTALAGTLPGVVNANVEVKEWRNEEGRVEVVFLHKIASGPADRSYGIHVAALAGLPASLISRAGQIMSQLEKKSASPSASAPTQTNTVEENPFERALKLLNPDAMTPLEALQTLISLKKQI
jgi:DNA mismatch repair protein MutS